MDFVEFVSTNLLPMNLLCIKHERVLCAFLHLLFKRYGKRKGSKSEEMCMLAVVH